MIPEKQKISWLTAILRGLLFAFIWLILSEGVISSWWIGVPAVLLAVIASIAIPPVPIVWHEVPRFTFFFLQPRSLPPAHVQLASPSMISHFDYMKPR